MDYKGEPTNKGIGPTGPAGPAGPVGPVGPAGPAGEDAQLYDYRGALNFGDTIEAKQYDAVFSNYDNQNYYKSTVGSGIVSCPPNSDFTLLNQSIATSIQQPNSLASVYVLDATLPLTNAYFSGVLPINVLGTGESYAFGFVNDANGLIKLDKDLNGKEGRYLINYTISLAVDNIASALGLNQGEVAILKVNGAGNTIYGRHGTGGYYANKPAVAGSSSIYVNISGSAIVELKFGEFIGLQALNMLLTNAYKYNISFTANWISPVKPVDNFVDNHIAIYDGNSYQFNLSSIGAGVIDIPIMFANNIQDGYSSNISFVSEDLPVDLNPTGLNNAYKNTYLKLEGGIPNPSALVVQSYVKANLNDVNSGGLSVLFQHSLDGVVWTDYTPTTIYSSNFSGNTELCMFWSNSFVPDSVLTQYLRAVIRYTINGSSTIPFINIVSNNFIVMPESALAGLPNISCNTVGIAGEDGLICNTTDAQFTIPTIRMIQNPNSANFQGGCNYVECQYTSPLGINANIPPQQGKLFISPNPIQNYNVIATFGIVRNSAITDNWVLLVREGTNTSNIPLVFSPLGLGLDVANVSINDVITLPDPYNDLYFNVVNLGLNPIQFTLSNYVLNVKAI